MKSNILLIFLLSATNIFAQIQTTNIVQQTTEDEAYITYNLGDEVVEGTLPPAETLNIGDTLVIPFNRTLYVDGKTLVAWTDGVNTYKTGESVKILSNMVLTPIFRDNTLSLSDCSSTTTVTWDFQRKNGAPSVNWQNLNHLVWVAQAMINYQEEIDVKISINTQRGKLANTHWLDWCQINSGTTITLPTFKGTRLNLESYHVTTTTTIDGEIFNNDNSTSPTYFYEGVKDSVDIVFGDGFYFRFISAEYPPQKESQNSSLSVTLPYDAWDGKYKNLIIELTNKTKGGHQTYIISEHSTYTFGGLNKNEQFRIEIKNSYGDTITAIDNIILNKDKENTSITFNSPIKVQDLLVRLLDNDSTDITSQAQISWYNSQGEFLKQGNKLGGLVAGTQILYKITLPEELGTQYAFPKDSLYTVTDGENNITLQLQPIEKIAVSGIVKDSITGKILPNAYIYVQQLLNGKYTVSSTNRSDEKGNFAMELYKDSTVVTVSASNYISQKITETKESYGDIYLKPITGAVITTSFTYTASRQKDDNTTEVQDWYDDTDNIGYSIYNETTGKSIKNFNVQYPNIVLLDETGIGDSLTITAFCKKNTFNPITTGTTIGSDNRANIQLGIMQLGGISASFRTTKNNSVEGVLYDANGHFVSKQTYKNARLELDELQDGDYILVTKGGNDLYNSVYNFSELTAIGLIENADYLTDSIHVQSGRYSFVENEEVPLLDESKLYYTGQNTVFSVNKSSIIVGNYLTLESRLDFKEDYINEVDNIYMIYDIPKSASFLENSVMVGNKVASYTIEENRLTVPVANYNERVRFCIIPTQSGTFSPNAFVQFDIAGNTLKQPIGNATYTTVGFSINVPKTITKAEVPITGKAIGKSKIEIYANNSLIGETTSLANGSWSATCLLNKPYNLSTHKIYAQATTPQDMKLLSETKECVYDMNTIQVSKVTMYHDNPEIGKMYEIVFDFLNPSVQTQNYIYYIYNKNFTFTIDFTENDTTKISDVILYVKTGKGNHIPLKAQYDKYRNMWVANGEFGNMYDGDLPVNVSVDYNLNTFIVSDYEEFDNIYKTGFSSYAAISDSLSNIDTVYSQISEALSNSLSTKEDIADIINKYLVIDPSNNSENLDGITEENIYQILEEISNDNESLLDSINNYINLYYTPLYNFNYHRDIEYTVGDFHVHAIVGTCENVNFKDDYHSIPNTHNNTILQKIEANQYVYIDSCKNLCITLNWNQYTFQTRSISETNYGTFLGDDFYDLPELPDNLVEDMIAEVRSAIISEIGSNIMDNTLEKLSNYGNIYDRCKYLSKLSNLHGDFIKGKTGEEFDRLYNSWVKCGKELAKVAKAKARIEAIKSWSDNYYLDFAQILSGYIDVLHNENLTLKQIRNIEVPYCVYQTNLFEALYVEKEKKHLINMARWSYLARLLSGNLGHLPDKYLKSNKFASFSINMFLSLWNNYVAKDNEIAIQRAIESLEDYVNLLAEQCEDKVNQQQGKHKSGIKDVEFSIDPSGYVYEGVPSNRLQGVTATVYYKETVEDMYGDKHEEVRMWDAEEYGQQNPLITDEYGMYRWDVPQGLWQVKFEKEGYETTYSDWLPVPPPQLDVNIAMKQFVQPEVKEVRAYESGIVIEFEKYMLPDSLNTNNIRAMKADSTWVNGQIEWTNREQVSNTDSLTFVSKVKFIPDTPFLPTDTVTLIINSHVVSYTGIQMEEDYVKTFCITNEITGIEVDSLVRVLYGGEKELVINAVPSFAAAGKRLIVGMSSTMIVSVDADTLTFDVNGQATLTVKGELPGFTILSMQVDSTDIQAVTSVFVGNAAQITTIAPRASLASGIEVESGTTVALTCETANAVIYYTLDGSCPCDGSTRFTYTTPIVIDKDLTIKAIAFNQELGESEIVTYMYKVKNVDETEREVMSASTITCLPISGGVEVDGVRNLDVSIFNLQGLLMHKSLDLKRNKLFIKLPEGLYIVKVHGKTFKVLVKK